MATDILVTDPGKALHTARKAAQMTQIQVATLAGVNEIALSRWERQTTDALTSLWLAAVNACGYEVILRKRQK